MEDLFVKLETRISNILQKYEKLQNNIKNMEQSKIVLSRKNEILATRNQIAISQIENMVSRLKAIEKIS